MNRTILSLILLLLTSLTLSAQDCPLATVPPADGKIYNWCYTPNVGTKWNTQDYEPYIINKLPFRLLKPKNFDSPENANRRYPLVILLHGRGEFGDDNNFQLKFGGKEHLNAREKGLYDGFVMVPQNEGSYFSPADYTAVVKFIDNAIRDYRVDEFRVHIVGYSSGAKSAWIVANDNVKKFASLVPISWSEGKLNGFAENLKYVAMWHTQGGRDGNPKPEAGKETKKIYEGVGANYRFYFHPDLGHNTWDITYGNPDYYKFLMQNTVIQIHPLFFKYNYCQGEAISGTLGVRQGFEGYKWKREGVLISGATSNEYKFTNETLPTTYTAIIKHNGVEYETKPITLNAVAPTPTPTIVASGPTALPTLDGRRSVTLKGPANLEKYLWTIEGKAETLDSETILVSTAGVYRLVVTESLGCPSAPSAPLKVTFNQTGVLPAPTSLTSATISESQLSLKWVDNSTNETGFELYRSTDPDGPWVLVDQLPANATSYVDKNLTAYTRYFYKLRSVNQDGGSTYADGTGKTQGDKIAPTVPGGVAFFKTLRTSQGLKWQPSTDNADQSSDLVYEVYTGDGATFVAKTKNTELELKDLSPGQVYSYVVRAVDRLGNKSQFSNRISAGTYANGLAYTYFEGEATSVVQIPVLTTVRKGMLPNFIIKGSNVKTDYFAFMFEGHINIPSSGNYTFHTTSNDGSTVYINDQLVVNNDWTGGGRDSRSASGSIQLTKGFHEIKVSYFERYAGGEMLEVYWETSGLAKEKIPNEAFTENFSMPSPPSSPAELKAEALDDTRIGLSWKDNSNNETGFELLRSTSNDGVYTLAKLVGANKTSYTDGSLQPGTTYFYKLRAISNSGESAYTGQDSNGIWVNATTTGSSSGNAAPILAAIKAINAPYGATTTIVLKASDEDGDALSFSASNLPAFALLTDHKDGTASLTITPAEDQQGTYDGITITVKDGKGGSDSENIFIVVDENRAPGIIQISPVSLRENENELVEVMAYDPDEEKISLSLIDAPPFLSLIEKDNNTATIDITPRFGHAGTYPVTVKAVDSKGASYTTVFMVYVSEVHISYTVKVNLNNSYQSQAPSPWINFNRSPTTGSMAINMLDTDAKATNLTLTVLDNFGLSEAGATTGNNTGVIPDAAMKSYFYGWDDASRRIRISNANPDLTYKITIFGSSTRSATSAEPTEYTIGGISKRLETFNNTSETVVFDNILALDKEIIIGIKRTNANSFAYINALIIEAYYVDKTSPLTPTELVATRSANNIATLKWRDNATNEASYTVSKSSDGVNFTSLASIAANTTSYSDAAISAVSNYYYRVQASNENGQSKWSNVAALNTNDPSDPNDPDPDPDPDPEPDPDPNPDPDPDPDDPNTPDPNAPVIANFPTVVVAPEGQVTRVEFDLSDPNGKELELIVLYMPDFARIEYDATKKKGVIIVEPTIHDLGFYSGIQFNVSNGSSETDKVFSISVKDSGKTATYINMGNNAYALRPWNNTKSTDTKVILAEIFNENKAKTGYSLHQIKNFSKAELWGETTLNNSGLYPDEVTQTAYIISRGRKAIFEVRGLASDLLYNFVFFGSNIYKSKAGKTIYSINGQEVSLDVQSNIDKTVQLNGIKADATGKVTISVWGVDDESNYNHFTPGGFLNAMIIEEYPAQTPILEPKRLSAFAVSPSQVDLSWTDNSYQEDGFEIWRRTLPNGEFEKIHTTAKDVTSYSDHGLTANTGYEYIARAKKGADNSDFTLASQAATLKEFIYINFNQNTTDNNYSVGGKSWNNSFWNNTNRVPKTDSKWTNLFNQDKTTTTVSLQLTSFMEANGAGQLVEEGVGIYPSKAIRSFWFNEVGTNGELRVYGLNPNLTYNFRFFASSAYGKDNGVTYYRIGTKYQPEMKQRSLDVQNNIKNTAVIRDVKPDAAGEVIIEIEPGESSRYSYINAMVIESRDGTKEKNGANSVSFKESALSFNFDPETINQITTVYPNPTRGELYIDFVAETTGTSYLQVMDMTGRIIYSKEVNTKEGPNTFSLDLRNPTIRAGIYILNVKSMDFESKVIRFIKQ